MWYLVSASSSSAGIVGLNHVLQNVGAQFFVATRLGVLGGDHDRVDADRLAVRVVLDRDLGFAVGPEVRKRAVLADFGQLAAELVRQRRSASASAPAFSLQA